MLATLKLIALFDSLHLNTGKRGSMCDLRLGHRYVLIYLCKGEVVEEMIVADSSHEGGDMLIKPVQNYKE